VMSGSRADTFRRLWQTVRPMMARLPDRGRIRAFHAYEFARCMTPRKLANWIAIQIGRRLRLSQTVGMPTQYFIDPINVCNLHCPLCPTGRGVLARPRGRMALTDFCGIIDQIAPYAYRIELYNWGEPLLHPEIAAMIEYASRRRISVGLSSNLNRLDRVTAEHLIHSGLSQLIVSVDGATQSSYATYRRGGKLEAVLSNLGMLVDARQALGQTHPFVVARMLIGKHNQDEIEAVRRLVYDIGVDSFSTGMLYIDTRDARQVQEWVPDDPASSPYRGGTVLENEWACHELWESMVINWDGGVAPCCWLHDAQYDFGNVMQETIRQIWKGPHYVSARRAIGRRRQHRQPVNDVPTICHRCRGHPHYMAY
jgi:radical SAM protein with 4Fe4S-binding SPASM domain